jgi:hypothetical protein
LTASRSSFVALNVCHLDALISKLLADAKKDLPLSFSPEFKEPESISDELKANLKTCYRAGVLPVDRGSRARIDLRFVKQDLFKFPSGINHSASLQALIQHVREQMSTTAGKAPCCLMGPSGCGKTKALIELSRTYYCIFIDFSKGEDFTDRNVKSVCDHITAIYKGTPENNSKWYETRLVDAEWRVTVELCARWLLLLVLADNRAAGTVSPSEFLDSQLGNGQSFIRIMVRVIIRLALDSDAIQELHDFIITQLSTHHKLKFGNQGPILLLDEAGVARDQCESIVSLTALRDAEWKIEVLREREKAAVDPEYRRGVLRVFTSVAVL